MSGKQTVFGRRPLARFVAPSVAGTALLALLATPVQPVFSSPHDPVVRVEEDWRLVLNEPNGLLNAPQFHTVISPLGGVDGPYGQITWNYQDAAEAVPGGMQMQSWSGDNMSQAKDLAEGVLSQIAEAVTWTARMEMNAGGIRVSVRDGQSSTWGSFGGAGWYVDIDAPTGTLDGYNTSNSVQNSWITYGSNRVSLLVIEEVRRYGPNGLLSVDSTPKVVFQISSE
jgi:hypothetical protein